MAKKNPAVDAYIKKSPAYAQPILKRLRSIIHKGCPKLTEEIKWGSPFYLYQDRVLCATMAFKAHCALVFWKAALISKKKGNAAKVELKRLRKISQVQELPAEKELLGYIKLAMHFNEPTTKLPPRKERSAPVAVPVDLAQALRRNSKASKTFKAFTPTKQKDYIYWITGAKTDETRERRLETAVDWMAQGKSRNWKYEESSKKKR